ncbi:MAG: hypothetical protein H6718_05955 [Polyangiaceae bacterium]|nr:hypothetical protein [Polyangiaceae bacterium]MCB9607507.1 hypothetical protein [Polyangiaceae bacterium]
MALTTAFAFTLGSAFSRVAGRFAFVAGFALALGLALALVGALAFEAGFAFALAAAFVFATGFAFALAAAFAFATGFAFAFATAFAFAFATGFAFAFALAAAFVFATGFAFAFALAAAFVFATGFAFAFAAGFALPFAVRIVGLVPRAFPPGVLAALGACRAMKSRDAASAANHPLEAEHLSAHGMRLDLVLGTWNRATRHRESPRNQLFRARVTGPRTSLGSQCT